MNRDQQKLQEAKDVVSSLSKMVNCFDPSVSGFVEEFFKMHPTLQQNCMKIFLAIIERWSENFKHGYYDLRSEDTCRIANKMIKAIEDDKYLASI
jgi:hypothetical protein